MIDDYVQYANDLLEEARETLPPGSNRDTAIAQVVATQAVAGALLAVERRLAEIEARMAG